jgi:hypothetical protein
MSAFMEDEVTSRRVFFRDRQDLANQLRAGAAASWNACSPA